MLLLRYWIYKGVHVIGMSILIFEDNCDTVTGNVICMVCSVYSNNSIKGI